MRDGREAGGQATFDAMVEVSPGQSRVFSDRPLAWLGTREDPARARRVAVGHEDDHLALIAHTERVDRLGDIAPQHGADAPALEEAAHDERLTLVAAAAHLGEGGYG